MTFINRAGAQAPAHHGEPLSPMPWPGRRRRL